MSWSTTKAWTYSNTGYPTALHQAVVRCPTRPPTSTSLLIRVRAAALNPVDVQLMNLPIWGLPLPFSPFNNACKPIGEDFSGTVIVAGSEVEGLKSGDDVFGFAMGPLASGMGRLAEVAVIDTKNATVLKKPDGWSWEQAAALPLVWLTARTCIDAVESYIGPRRRVVVLGGSSSTGMYVVYLAKARGWEILATCSSRNAEFVQSMGASQTVDYTAQSVRDQVQKYNPDAIVDCVGGTECLGLARRYVTIVGDKTSRMSMGGAAIYLWNPQMLLRNLRGRFGFGEVYDCLNLQAKKEWLEEVLELPTDMIVIDSTFAFDRTKEAFARLDTGRARGKVVITMDHGHDVA